MDKLKMQTPNLVDDHIDKIAEIFPHCITEDRDENGNVRRTVDFDLLQQELSNHVVEGPRERYTLNWPGKNEAILTANAPIAKTLRPCEEESVDFETTQNLFIEGDNLDVLKLLQETYLNKVKMIYIDPPYNTGSDFIYEDDFAEDTESFLRRSNQKDDKGNRLVANTDSHGRFHSDWLSMMYPRVKLARNLLDTNGIICTSISDIELSNLRKLLDEIFGEKNYINTISVVSKVAAGASGGGEDKRLKKNIENILIYAKNIDKINPLSDLYTKRPLLEVIESMRANGESWKYTSILLDYDQREFVGETKDADGNPISIFRRKNVKRTTIRKVCENESLSEDEAYRKYLSKIFSDTNAQSSIRTRVIDFVGNLNSDEIIEVEYVPRSGKDKGVKVTHTYISNTVRRVIWLSDVAEVMDGTVFKKEKLGTLWAHFDYNNVGKEGEVPFPDGKKPIALVRQCLQLQKETGGLVLDFFSGSCTTAHGVMEQNLEDNGNRRFIMVQLPEPVGIGKEYKDIHDFCNEAGIEAKISEIGKERIRRAGKKIKEENPATAQNPDIGFRVFKVDSSNMKDVYYTPDEIEQGQLDLFANNIKEDRRPEDLLFQVFLDCGLELTLPVVKETIEGKTVFFVDGNVLAACFDPEITEELVKILAKRRPQRAVFRDDAYRSDSVKINVEQIFTLISPTTEVKSI